MSGKLDQSLDAIISTGKSSGGRGRGRRATGRGTGRPVAAAANGIKKSTRSTRASIKATTVPTGPAGGSGDSKVIVSNLVCVLKISQEGYYPCQLSSANVT